LTIKAVTEALKDIVSQLENSMTNIDNTDHGNAKLLTILPVRALRIPRK